MSALCKLAVAAASPASNIPLDRQPFHANTADSSPSSSNQASSDAPKSSFSDPAAPVVQKIPAIGPTATASLIQVLDACAQQRVYSDRLLALCEQALAREVAGLRPDAVGRLAWSLGMLGYVDRGLLDAIATHALMKSGRYTLQQVRVCLKGCVWTST